MNAETERHRAEVRWCISMGAAAFKAWFKGDANRPSLAKARSPAAAERLLRDVQEQARRGNTGQPGQWIESEQKELT